MNAMQLNWFPHFNPSKPLENALKRRGTKNANTILTPIDVLIKVDTVFDICSIISFIDGTKGYGTEFLAFRCLNP